MPVKTQLARFFVMYPGSMITKMMLNMCTNISEETVKTQIKLLLRSSLIKVYTVCYSTGNILIPCWTETCPILS